MNNLQCKLTKLQNRYSMKEISQITEISKPYLYQIRQGKKVNVSSIYTNAILKLYNREFGEVPKLTKQQLAKLRKSKYKKEPLDYRVIMLLISCVILLIIIIS